MSKILQNFFFLKHFLHVSWENTVGRKSYIYVWNVLNFGETTSGRKAAINETEKIDNRIFGKNSNSGQK